MTALQPGATIGIVGGGHLGRMTALAAARLGYRCHVFSPEADGPGAQVAAAATVADLSDVSSDGEVDPSDRGWYLNLDKGEGEKALSSPAVFNSEILFTTYSPNAETDGDADPCSVTYGQSYLYRVNLKTGQRYRYTLLQPGLPPGVTVLLGEDGEPAIVVGTEAVSGEANPPAPGIPDPVPLRDLRHGRWMQLTPDAAGAIKLPQDADEDSGN